MWRPFPPVLGGLAALTLALGAACSNNPAAPASSSGTAAATTSSGSTPKSTSTVTRTTAATGTLTTSELVDKAGPSVVRIQAGSAIGSGFVIDPAGYIITNNHVIAGASVRSLLVTIADGGEFSAQVVGADPRADLALLKIDAGVELPALPLANLQDVDIGDDVVAIGYALDLQQGEGASFTVTRGIVSQKNRGISETSPILGAVQTDAAINQGNSGGPLLNLKGEVVGVNTALQPDNTSVSGVAQGIGYAVGSDTIRAVYEELKANGRVTRGLLGVANFQSLRPAKARELNIPENTGGIYLPEGNPSSVAAGGPAAAAGIRAGDVITKIAGQPVRTEADLAIAMIEGAPGDKVEVEYYRNGKASTVTVTLGTPPGS